MLNFMFWLIFGFLTGWIGAILAGAQGGRIRTLPIVLAGTVGGFIGGASTQALFDSSLTAHYNPTSLLGAVFLASVMVVIATLSMQEPTSDQ